MTTINDPEDDAQQAESAMFRDALLTGDGDAPITREDFNRLVTLAATRFDSAARRTNKGRKETRDGIAALRTDLGPVITISKVIPMLGGLGSILTVAAVILKIFG